MTDITMLIELAKIEGSSSVKGRIESVRDNLKDLKFDGPEEGVISIKELTQFMITFFDEILKEEKPNGKVLTEFDKADRSAFTGRL